MCWRTSKGQATVEAAVSIPVIFLMLLLLLQPGIILYDRMVMRAAAAEGCRLLATASEDSGAGQARCEQLVKRQLSAIPSMELFHVHDNGCSYRIELTGNSATEWVGVAIENRVKLLPLLDFSGTLAGLADGQGCLLLRVEESCQTQPDWVLDSSLGLDPQSWVHAREGEFA